MRKFEKLSFEVVDIEKLTGIMLFLKTATEVLYIFVWHPELKWYQNLLCNFGFARIIEKI